MTFSIAARCPSTGQLGVAVASAVLAAGSRIVAARPGVGVVAVQAGGWLQWRRALLDLLGAGFSPDEAVVMLAGAADGPASQLAAVCADGRSAAVTGPDCVPQAGHVTGEGVSAQANMMLSDDVWPAMLETFAQTSGSLAQRLVAALVAADRLGADFRGRQSAGLLVVSGERGHEPTGDGDDPTVDLRVDDGDHPVEELQRLVEVHRAHRHLIRAGMAATSSEKGEELRSAGRIAPRDRVVAPLVAIAAALDAPGPATVEGLRRAAELNPATLGWARRRAEQDAARGRPGGRRLLDLLDESAPGDHA